MAVSTFDAVGGLIIGTIGGIGLVINDLFEQWRNGRDRRRGAR
jgi:anaerobic C4-dicarboxylate transporter